MRVNSHRGSGNYFAGQEHRFDAIFGQSLIMSVFTLYKVPSLSALVLVKNAYEVNPSIQEEAHKKCNSTCVRNQLSNVLKRQPITPDHNDYRF